MSARRICVVTGSRAEFGLLQPVIAALRRRPGLRVQVVATGMHLLRRHGNTVRQVKAEAGLAWAVPMYQSIGPGDDGRALGHGIAGLAKVFGRLNPDVVMVLGDRLEPLAAAAAAFMQGRLVAHIHGGDRTFGAHRDEPIRHAITRLAHIHFPATRRSAERIRRMGEDRWRIFTVGTPGLDALRGLRFPGRRDWCLRWGWDPSARIVLWVQHPLSGQRQAAADQMARTRSALRALGWPVLAVYPNNDPGSGAMMAVLDQARRDPLFRVVPNLPRPDFLAAMKHAAVLVGNSSAGLIDGAALHLPMVHVGDRNRNREQRGNVLFVPHEAGAILRGICRVTSDTRWRRGWMRRPNPFGDGRTGDRIARILSGITPGPKWLWKTLAY